MRAVPAAFGWTRSLKVNAGLPSTPGGEKGGQPRRVPLSKLGIDRGAIFAELAEKARRIHLGEEDGQPSARQLGQDRIEIGARRLKRNSAQQIIGAEFDDHEIGSR